MRDRRCRPSGPPPRTWPTRACGSASPPSVPRRRCARSLSRQPRRRAARPVLARRHRRRVPGALGQAEPGDVLVVDTTGRPGCVGDLVALEVARAGLAGIVIGLHRDTAQLRPSASRSSAGRYPVGPSAGPAGARRAGLGLVRPAHRARRRRRAADDDGVVFLPADRRRRDGVRHRPHPGHSRNARRAMRAGTTLREQTRFDEYHGGPLARRPVVPAAPARSARRSMSHRGPGRASTDRRSRVSWPRPS